MSDLLRRQAATERTMRRFGRKKFDWAKRATCIHMVRFHLRALGHSPPAVPEIRSLIGARRALAAKGWGHVGDMMDTLLPGIAPAAMLIGDVAMMAAEDEIGALVVNVGGKVMGWHDEARGMVIIEPLKIEKAWRV